MENSYIFIICTDLDTITFEKTPRSLLNLSIKIQGTWRLKLLFIPMYKPKSVLLSTAVDSFYETESMSK